MTDARRRIPANAGFCNISRLPKGPNGRPLCRRCSTEVPTARNTFCSAACVHEWKLRTQPRYQAWHVLERDRGVCEACGLDCVALLKELKDLRAACRVERYGAAFGFDGDLPSDRNLDRFQARLTELALPRHLSSLSRRLWEMDHRTPVVEGGGSCGLENLRTLCWACHRLATAELARRRAASRGTPAA